MSKQIPTGCQAAGLTPPDAWRASSSRPLDAWRPASPHRMPGGQAHHDHRILTEGSDHVKKTWKTEIMKIIEKSWKDHEAMFS